MPVKYAEITIVINVKEEKWLNYCKRLLGNENSVNENDTIIILFDDGIICDVKRECVDTPFIMGPKSRNFPIYFNKKDGKTLFFTRPKIKEDGSLTLNFRSIFPKLNTKIASTYNAIYTDVFDIIMLAIIKVSDNTSSRYLIAYEDAIFTHSDILYFVNYIFTDV
jgi:hypothetical protein